MKILRFTVPAPSSSKNSRQLFVNAKGKPGSLPSKRAKASKRQIQAAALTAINELEGELARGSLFGAEDDIQVDMLFDAETQEAHIVVSRSGPKPTKGNTGRGRDLDNMLSTVLDALQGIAYADDKQVSDLTVERVYE